MNGAWDEQQASSGIFKYLIPDKGLIYGGCWIAIVCSPLYYLIWTYIFPQSYDSVFLRLSSCLLGLLIILYRYWPSVLKRYFPTIWLVTLLYVVPFTHIFLALKNQFSYVWIVCLTFTPFMLAYFVRTPWMTLLLLSVATACSTCLYILIDGLPLFLLDFIHLLPLAFFVVGGALLLSNSNNRAAEKRLRATRALAASIAHEMRNPLSQIHGNLYLIEELQKEIPYMYGAKPVVTQHINNAKRLIKNGLQVIDLTMDAIKDIPINRDDFQLLSARALVDESVADYAYEEAEHAKLVSVEGEDFKLMAEPVILKYVLFNLLQNALWYIKTQPDTEINISLLPNAGDGYHHIEVRDDGPGISPEAIPNLFDSFYTSGKHGGTGLGLSYCKRTMNALGSDIRCHSELNQYTVFTLSFPVVTAEQEAQGKPNQEQQEVRPISLAGKTVLIVEDDSFSRKLTESMLRKLQMCCFTAKNGEEALEVLTRQRCDLILTDLKMPVINGLELTQRIRSHSEDGAINPLTPIIALSSETEEVVKTAMRSGINDYLAKPVILEDLLTKLRQWLPVHT